MRQSGTECCSVERELRKESGIPLRNLAFSNVRGSSLSGNRKHGGMAGFSLGIFGPATVDGSSATARDIPVSALFDGIVLAFGLTRRLFA